MANRFNNKFISVIRYSSSNALKILGYRKQRFLCRTALKWTWWHGKRTLITWMILIKEYLF